ncbi:MAG: hypothetical protein ACRD2O_06310 [Terriglobia bacterium]
MRNVVSDPIFLYDRQVSSEGDPKRWFEGLPWQYNGSYLRAGIVDSQGMEVRPRSPIAILGIGDPQGEEGRVTRQTLVGPTGPSRYRKPRRRVGTIKALTIR